MIWLLVAAILAGLVNLAAMCAFLLYQGRHDAWRQRYRPRPFWFERLWLGRS